MEAMEVMKIIETEKQQAFIKIMQLVNKNLSEMLRIMEGMNTQIILGKSQPNGNT